VIDQTDIPAAIPVQKDQQPLSPDKLQGMIHRVQQA
jgi:hypothetical protein